MQESKSLFPREVAQNRCGLRHTPKGHMSEGPRGAPNTGDPHQAAVHPCDQRQFPHETRSSAQQPPCLPAGTRGLGCSRSPHIYRPSRLPGPRGSCLPSHREACKTNHCTRSSRSPRPVGPHPSYSLSPRPHPLTALPHSCQQPSASGLQ